MNLYMDDFSTPVLNFCVGCFGDQTEKFRMEINYLFFFPANYGFKEIPYPPKDSWISVLMLRKRA